MFKSIFWILVGAAGALHFDRWLEHRRRRFSPHALTGALIDKANDRLESKRSDPWEHPEGPV